MIGPFAEIAILGAGGMGTALGLLWARAGANVRLWARDADRAASMARSRRNDRHLPGVELPESIRPTGDAREALEGVDLVVAAVPSAYLRSTLRPLAAHVPRGAPVLSVVKGIELETFARPSQIIAEELGPRPIAVLSGPSHAEELARGLPASVVIAGNDEHYVTSVRDALNSRSFRIYSNGDFAGVELAGALKNILGIVAGICDGLGCGDNAKASILTRGLVEIARFGVAMGAEQATFAGLAGVGDVLTTCYSAHGRNRALGARIAVGEGLQAIQAGTADVAEGVFTTRSVYMYASREGIPMPITVEVYNILFEGKPPRAAVGDLMLRQPTAEWR